MKRHIKQQYVHRALKAVGANQDDIEKAEALLKSNQDLLPVLAALNDCGWLIQEGLRELQFDEKAAGALMAVGQDKLPVFPELQMYVDEEVQELLEDHENRVEYELSDAEAEALVQQLRSLDSLQRLALSRTVQAASELRRGSEMTAADACRAVGLRVN